MVIASYFIINELIPSSVEGLPFGGMGIFAATIAGLFGENNVSIESVIQEGRGDNAELVLVTHEAEENNLTSSIESISKLSSVSSVTSTIRVYI